MSAAIEFPDIKVTGIDSVGKKIRAVETISKKLGLKNIELINDRVENLKGHHFDVITSRAVGKVGKIIQYAYPLLEEGGVIVLYKSKGAKEEMDNAISTIRKYQLKIKPQIEYKLPLKEEYVRNLIILQR